MSALYLSLSPCGRGRLAEGERGEGCAVSLGTTPLALPLRGPLPLPQGERGI